MRTTKPYNIEPLWERVHAEGAAWAMMLGARGIRKSSEVQRKMLEKYYSTDREFIYLRRYKDEISDSACEQYWGFINDDPIGQQLLKDITKGEYNRIMVYRKKIFYAHTDETGKVDKRKQIGYCHALNDAGSYKSLQFPKVEDIIYEEFVPDRVTFLVKEPSKLQEYASTIIRGREGCTIWLIGNTISHLNPYAEAWGLKGVERMKPHQIDVYERVNKYLTEEGVQEQTVKIIVEQCAGQGIFSAIAFGADAKHIGGNSYREELQPLVRADFIEDSCECIYTIYLFYQNLKFRMDFERIDERRFFWYVRPAKSSIAQEDDELIDERVITDKPDFNPMHTTFSPVSAKERRLFTYFAEGKVWFSDNMTGTDWMQVYQAMLRD